MKKALLYELAKKNNASLLGLRTRSGLRWIALGQLYDWEEKERYCLKEWSEAVSYLLGCDVTFQSYEELSNSLKPFSLEVK